MEEAELQEILDLLDEADEAWKGDNNEHHGGDTVRYARWEQERKRFHDLITRLVAAQREAVT